MDRAFRPFRLQSPDVVLPSRFGFGSQPYRRVLRSSTHPLGRVPRGVTWASSLSSRLATTTGRIEFVILRTGRSPPVALHPAFRRRSYVRLQSSNLTPTGTSTLLIRSTCKRTRTPSGYIRSQRLRHRVRRSTGDPVLWYLAPSRQRGHRPGLTFGAKPLSHIKRCQSL